MSSQQNLLTVFEHEVIRFDKGEKRLSKAQFEALQLYHGNGVPYFKLCYNGIQFCQYVGVIQVGKTLIEVLPKADKKPKSETDENKWRDILINMMRAVGTFDIHSTSNGHLKVKPNTILDLYVELFIKETEYLLHHGLIKKYRKKEANETALKGRLLFGKQIQHNLTHQERFYVSSTTYDVEHQLHFILYKTIRLLKQINTNNNLQSRIGTSLLNFPEMPDLKVSSTTFDKFFNRKTQAYQKAIEIAKLLLLQYHPDVSNGKNNVLALMFDMNKLWEKFVYVSLKKGMDRQNTITAQSTKLFWKPEDAGHSKIRPDIVINSNTENCLVLDTKWKNLNGSNPSPEDLRQMYVYHAYFVAKRVALVYPSSEHLKKAGSFLNTIDDNPSEKECSIISIAVDSNMNEWQKKICERLGFG